MIVASGGPRGGGERRRRRTRPRRTPSSAVRSPSSAAGRDGRERRRARATASSGSERRASTSSSATSAARSPASAPPRSRSKEQGEGGRYRHRLPRRPVRELRPDELSAAKAGIVGFARTWAVELARDRVTVNAIVPTAWTQMTATIPALAPLAELVEAGKADSPKVRRRHALGPPEDCAPLAVFLASDEAADVTGRRSASAATSSPSMPIPPRPQSNIETAA